MTQCTQQLLFVARFPPSAMQRHLPSCSQQQLCLACLAVSQWGFKPPPSWGTPYTQALSNHLPALTPPEVLVAVSAGVLAGVRLQPQQQQLLLCDVTLRQLLPASDANDAGSSSGSTGSSDEVWPPGRLVQLLRGCLLLGVQPSVEWLAAWLKLLQQQLTDTSSSSSSGDGDGGSGWDIAGVAAALSALSAASNASAALAVSGGSSSSSSSSNSSSSSSNSSSGFLQAVVSYTQPLIETQPSPGPLVDLLWAFQTLNHTPPDEYLDLLLDEAAVKLHDSSTALLQQHYPHRSSRSSSSSSGGSGVAGTAEDEAGVSFTVADWGPDGAAAARQTSSSSSSTGSSSSSSSEEQEGYGEEPSSSSSGSSQPGSTAQGVDGEAVWSKLEAGAYKPSANITLARQHLESSWSMKVTQHPPTPGAAAAAAAAAAETAAAAGDPTSARSSSGSSSSSKQGKAPGGVKNGFTPRTGPGGTSSSGPSGGPAAAAQPPQPPSPAAIAASSSVVGQVLGLLSAVAALKLPVEPEWVGEVLGSLRGHFGVLGLGQVQRLLLLRELLGGSPDPEWVEELLTEVRGTEGVEGVEGAGQGFWGGGACWSTWGWGVPCTLDEQGVKSEP
jgi:hypothetical protein